MSYGLYLSAEGAYAQSKRLEVISNNLANVDTVGFKRQLALLQSRYAEAIEEGFQPDLGGGVRVRETGTDFSPGPVRRTGVPTDVAITGEGFFTVEKGDETLLTRAGNFRLTAQGQLVTQQGYPVLSDAGVPVYVLAENGPWRITEDGVVVQRGLAQRLGLVRPGSPEDLVRVGENLFRPLGETEPLAPEARHVTAEHLEDSGVKPALEMIAMIEAARILEANVNMMKTQDQMISALVNRVLSV